MINCTCGHFLVESESSQKINSMVLDTVKLKQRNRDVAKKKKRVQDAHHEKNHDRFVRNAVHESQLSSKIGYTEQKCIEMDNLAQGGARYIKKNNMVSHIE